MLELSIENSRNIPETDKNEAERMARQAIFILVKVIEMYDDGDCY